MLKDDDEILKAFDGMIESAEELLALTKRERDQFQNEAHARYLSAMGGVWCWADFA